jgi:hypothetical protein
MSLLKELTEIKQTSYADNMMKMVYKAVKAAKVSGLSYDDAVKKIMAEFRKLDTSVRSTGLDLGHGKTQPSSYASSDMSDEALKDLIQGLYNKDCHLSQDNEITSYADVNFLPQGVGPGAVVDRKNNPEAPGARIKEAMWHKLPDHVDDDTQVIDVNGALGKIANKDDKNPEKNHHRVIYKNGKIKHVHKDDLMPHLKEGDEGRVDGHQFNSLLAQAKDQLHWVGQFSSPNAKWVYINPTLRSHAKQALKHTKDLFKIIDDNLITEALEESKNQKPSRKLLQLIDTCGYGDLLTGKTVGEIDKQWKEHQKGSKYADQWTMRVSDAIDRELREHIERILEAEPPTDQYGNTNPDTDQPGGNGGLNGQKQRGMPPVNPNNGPQGAEKDEPIPNSNIPKGTRVIGKSENFTVVLGGNEQISIIDMKGNIRLSMPYVEWKQLIRP